MNAVDVLLGRNSHAKLDAPAPEGQHLDTIFRAGLRAPDHAHLRPWQFVTIAGERRAALGEVFVESRQLRGEEDEVVLNKARNAPLRAPLIIAGLLKPKSHPKVPRGEQVAAVACALHGMSLAAEALGYGAMWRTGGFAVDPHVINALGGEPGDEVIGFLYLGTKVGPGKLIPELAPEAFVTAF